ncbi:hypothetical protein HXX01_03840 [Candidatus Nomurabacteria bacterium]|nr:hypothetical protein [Candidatus Nomurabacteria bacterium]
MLDIVEIYFLHTMILADIIQSLPMQADQVGGNPTMNLIELSPDFNWLWIASIVDCTKDSERDGSFPQWPLIDLGIDCSSFTGEYSLKMNQGGLQNREIPKSGKELFKEQVLPYLMQSVGSNSRITGMLDIHFAQGAVKKAILHYN